MAENKNREKLTNELLDWPKWFPQIGEVESDKNQDYEVLKNYEKQYRNLFETAPDGIIVVNTDGIITLCNDTFAKMIGLTKNDILGKHFLKIPTLKSNDVEKYFNIFKSILNRETTSPIEFSWIHSDKTRHSAEVRFNLLEEAGIILGIQAIARDVTEQKIKYEQIRIAVEQLYQVQKLETIGMMAGGIAHDFNNLLAAILGNISLAKMIMTPEEKVANILTKAEEVSLQAKELMQQLLTLTKSGKPEKKLIFIKKLIKEATDLALRGSNINYEFSAPASVLPVEIDEGRLIQIINNIIIHSKKGMPEGGTIKIWAENVTITENDSQNLEKGIYVKISIRDQGAGITNENLEQIFAPFFTTESDRDFLGLKIAHLIVNENAGHFAIETKKGIGTTFDIYLPACFKEIPVKDSVKEDIKKISLDKRCGKILVMDDEENVRVTVGSILNHFGYTVEFAGNGLEAIEIYKKAKESGKPFDAVIADLTIRGGAGAKEIIQELLKIDSNVKTLVTSGYSNDPLIREPRKYGFSGVVVKPYQVEDVLDALGRVLNERNESK
ncbi:MAG: PAS domain S-box protein [candidate division WOR-3 bacterium]|nr:PAS domain S-box protein [candidate division WOR-3 bacterium]